MVDPKPRGCKGMTTGSMRADGLRVTAKRCATSCRTQYSAVRRNATSLGAEEKSFGPWSVVRDRLVARVDARLEGTGLRTTDRGRRVGRLGPLSFPQLTKCRVHSRERAAAVRSQGDEREAELAAHRDVRGLLEEDAGRF